MEAATASSVELDAGGDATRSRVSSIRQRCLRSVAAIAALTWLAVTLGVVWFARCEAEEMFDNSLREVAHNVLAFSGHELAEIVAEGAAVQASFFVSGSVTTTATRSLADVSSAKSTVTSSSCSDACTNGCWRTRWCRCVEQCAHSAWPLLSMKLNVPCFAAMGASSRSVLVSSAIGGTLACALASSCISQQNARSLSVPPTGRKAPCRRGSKPFRSPLCANTQ